MKEDKKEEPIYSDTAYDDAFRTMESECDDLVIPFVNHMFGEKYDSSAEIKRLRNEQLSEDADGGAKKRITDSHFEIIFNNITKRYHLECESKKYDGSILVRIFEYDTGISIDSPEEKDFDKLRVKLPKSGLLLLKSSPNAPGKAVIEIELPNGNEATYEVPIIRASDFSVDDIFDKEMYMLIPFYFFNFEAQFDDIDKSQDKIEALFKIYDDIYRRLDALQENGILSAFSVGAIIRLTHSVAYKLTMKRDNIQKKVGDVMGGKVLDLPEIRIYHEGIDRGRAEERAENEKEIKELTDRNEELESEIEKLRLEIEKLKNNK